MVRFLGLFGLLILVASTAGNAQTAPRLSGIQCAGGEVAISSEACFAGMKPITMEEYVRRWEAVRSISATPPRSAPAPVPRRD